MRNLTGALVALVLVSSSAALAEARPVAIDRAGLELIAAVLSHPEKLAEAAKYGPKVIAVTVRPFTTSTHYQVAVGSCTFDPAHICLTKAILSITRTRLHAPDTVSVTPVMNEQPKFTNRLDENTQAVVQAMMQVPSELRDLAARKETVVGASVTRQSRALSYFSVSTSPCANVAPGGRACFGGARLQITATTKVSGIRSRTTYTAKLLLKRG